MSLPVTPLILSSKVRDLGSKIEAFYEKWGANTEAFWAEFEAIDHKLGERLSITPLTRLVVDAACGEAYKRFTAACMKARRGQQA